MGGASGTSLTALSGPHTPLFQGPFRAPLRRLGAVCCAPSGPRQRRLRRAFRPQPAPRTPATGWPLGPLAGACESQHEATAVAIGRPGHHRPGLCCVVVLWAQGPSPQPGRQPGPCAPQLAPAGMALLPGPGMCTRPPGEVRSPLPPGLSPCSCARATPAAGRGQGRSAPQRSSSCSCAIAIGSGATGPASTGRPGLGPADARLLRWRGVLQPPSRKQAGPRVPLNRILFNRRCVVAFAP